jgi:cysteine sulfinate desulfinase/cysteine desulfurase-like protein
MTAYLDNASTTRLRPEVLQAMLPILQGIHGNPSSIHAAGRQARRAIEDARERIADRLKVTPLQVIFTSGATEANNLALFGAAPRRLVISGVEHESVMQAARKLPDVATLPVDEQGRVSANDLVQALPASLVSPWRSSREWRESAARGCMSTPSRRSGKSRGIFLRSAPTWCRSPPTKFMGPKASAR